MSISNAKKFVMNFYANPKLRVKIAKIIKKDFTAKNKKDKLNFIILTAKKLGYNFNENELKLIQKIKYQRLNESELEIVKGGININENVMEKTNLKLKNFLDIF